MIIECVKCDPTTLGILLNVFNPSTDAAQVVTSATATFYRVNSSTGLFVAQASPAPVALAQLGAVVGLWQAVVDVTGINIRTLVLVVTAVVGGVNRTAIKPLGGVVGGMETFVGGPAITVTPGPMVHEGKV